MTKHLPPPTRYGPAEVQRAAAVPPARAFPPPPPTRYAPQLAARAAGFPPAHAAANALQGKRLFAPPSGRARHVLQKAEQKFDLSSLKKFDDLMARRKQGSGSTSPPTATSTASTATTTNATSTPAPSALKLPLVMIDMSRITAAAATSASSKEVTIGEYGFTLKFERSATETVVHATYDGAFGNCVGKWHDEEQKVFGVKNIVARALPGGFGTVLFGAFVYYCLAAPLEERPVYFCLSTDNTAIDFWAKYGLKQAPYGSKLLKGYSKTAAALKATVDEFQQVPLYAREAKK